MKNQLTHVSKVQAAKVAASLYLVVSTPLVLLMMLPMLFTNEPGLPLYVLLLMPLLYAVFGFIFTFLAAWAYNIVASRFGGFEYTTIEIDA